MGIRGDFGKLDQLTAGLKNALAGELKTRLLTAAAEEAKTQVALGFRASRDPYGAAWAALKYRKGMPLRDTGRLANSFTARPTGDGFEVGTNVSYARFHQYGTKGRRANQQRQQVVNARGRFMRMNGPMTQRQIARLVAASQRRGGTRTLHFQAGRGGIPQRMMVPEGGLSPVWQSAIEKAVDVAFKNYFRRLGL